MGELGGVAGGGGDLDVEVVLVLDAVKLLLDGASGDAELVANGIGFNLRDKDVNLSS